MKFLPLVLFMTLQVQQELAKLFRRHLSLLLKLAIIPMISIVRIYYKDTITLSDSLPSSHGQAQLSSSFPCPSVTSGCVITWTLLPSAPWIRKQVIIL